MMEDGDMCSALKARSIQPPCKQMRASKTCSFWNYILEMQDSLTFSISKFWNMEDVNGFSKLNSKCMNGNEFRNLNF